MDVACEPPAPDRTPPGRARAEAVSRSRASHPAPQAEVAGRLDRVASARALPPLARPSRFPRGDLLSADLGLAAPLQRCARCATSRCACAPPATTGVTARADTAVEPDGPLLQRTWRPWRRKREEQPAPPEGRDKHGCCTGGACHRPDVQYDDMTESTRFTLTIAVDRERSNLAKSFVTGDVGHTWVKLSTDAGDVYSYGLYPRKGFNALFPTRTVDGCIHHPDTGHEPPLATQYKEISYDLPADRWNAAFDFAIGECQRRPRYNLFKNNCTTFAVDVARAASVTPPAASWMAIDNPNSIYEGIETDLAARRAAVNEESLRKINERLANRGGGRVATQ